MSDSDPKAINNSNLETTKDKPKLLDRVRTRVRARHLTFSTEEAYVTWIRRFIRFHQMRHPDQMGADEISFFLSLS